jgi:hypothetical protein
MRLWPQDRPGRSGTGVFSVEIPTDGIAAGTDGRPCGSDSGFSGDGSEEAGRTVGSRSDDFDGVGKRRT